MNQDIEMLRALYIQMGLALLILTTIVAWIEASMALEILYIKAIVN
jgi:hypothetical protein